MTSAAPTLGAALALAVLLASVVGACGDGETASGAAATTTGTAGGTGGTDDPTPDASCVRPGDAGNDKGVGSYCSPGGGQCSDFPEAGLCLADVSQDQWMCTRIGCDATTDCGADAGCLITTQGSACVPCRCNDTSIGCGSGGAGGSGGN